MNDDRLEALELELDRVQRRKRVGLLSKSQLLRFVDVIEEVERQCDNVRSESVTITVRAHCAAPTTERDYHVSDSDLAYVSAYTVILYREKNYRVERTAHEGFFTLARSDIRDYPLGINLEVDMNGALGRVPLSFENLLGDHRRGGKVVEADGNLRLRFVLPLK